MGEKVYYLTAEMKAEELRKSNEAHLKASEEADERCDYAIADYHDYIIAIQTKLGRVLCQKEKEVAFEFINKLRSICYGNDEC